MSGMLREAIQGGATPAPPATPGPAPAPETETPGQDPYPPDEDILYETLKERKFMEVHPGLVAAGWEYRGEFQDMPAMRTFLYVRGARQLSLYVSGSGVISLINFQ